ncbi:MAG: lamin tail domain-containing protein [Anaerolineae bacterium]
MRVVDNHQLIKTMIILLALLVSSAFLFMANLPVAPAVAAQIDDTPTAEPSSPPSSPEPSPQTDTPTPIPTPTDTVIAPPTETPTVLATASDTPTATSTPTLSPTETPTQTPPAAPSPAFTPTQTPAEAPVSTPTDTPTPVPAVDTPVSFPDKSSIVALALPGDVVINEVVTDPQQDWSTNAFNGVASTGSVNNTDEFVELYLKTGGLNLTGWTIELRDTTPVTGTLVSGGAFQVARYVGTGTFTNTLPGDYLVLGDVRGTGAMNNSILIVLKDNNGAVIDKVELGNDLEGDGPGDGAPDGTANGGNANNNPATEAIARYPNAIDTDNDVADFIARSVTMGGSNDIGLPTPTPSPTPTPIPPPPVPGSVIINEVAWGGTAASSTDEWIELLNVTTQTISLTNWVITSTNGLNIALSGVINPNDYYLIERTNNGVITDTLAELTPSFGSGLNNAGTTLFLSASGIMIDTANGDGGPWPAGSGSPDYHSMERLNPFLPDTDANWFSNDMLHRNGLARDGLTFINGTPQAAQFYHLSSPSTPNPRRPPSHRRISI